MNIIKGLDRISLVIAILSTVPGFMIGFFGVNDMFKGVAPEYIAWEQRYEDSRRELEKKYSEEVQKTLDENKMKEEEKKRKIEERNKLLQKKFGIGREPSEILPWEAKLQPWESKPRLNKRYFWVDAPLQRIKAEAPPLFKYPPIWQRTIGGIFFAPLSFVVVLFSLRGITRFFVWIVKGFKDE
jgi:hypothetical protein